MIRRPQVALRLPSSLPWATTFDRTFEELVHGLAWPADSMAIETSVARAEDETFELTIDGRPVMTNLAAHPVEPAVRDEISDRLLGRLPLLRGEVGRYSSVDGYLADLGFVEIGGSTSQSHHFDRYSKIAREAEARLERAVPRSLILEVPLSALREANAAELDSMVRLRERILARHGVELPEVLLQPSDDLVDAVTITINDVASPRQLAQRSWTGIVDCLEQALIGRLHWLLTASQVEESFGILAYLAPDLVDSCLACYPLPVLTACLRELLRGRSSIKNLSRIAWQLLEVGGTPRGTDTVLLAESPLLHEAGLSLPPQEDPIALASRIRAGITEEAWRMNALPDHGQVFRISREAEEALLEAEDAEALATTEWQVVREATRHGEPQSVIVHSVSAIGPISDVMQALRVPPRVIASAELPLDVNLDAPTAAG